MAGLLRRHGTNLALAGVALGLVATLVLTRESVTTGERRDREGHVLEAFREPEVTRLELTRTDASGVKERTLLVRSKPEDSGLARWHFEAPYQERADDAEVDDYVSTLGFADIIRRVPEEDVDRAAFGLGEPRLTLKVSMGEIEYELRLGKQAVSPAGSAYLEIAGRGAPAPGVVLISSTLVTQLDRDASHFRGRDLVPYLSIALKTLELTGRGGTRTLVRPSGEHAWDGWRFDGGGLRVNRKSLDHVLSQLADLNAESFLEVKEAEAALAAAETVRIRMVPKKEGSAVALLEVGGECPGGAVGTVALRREPDSLAGCVPTSVLEGLGTPAADLVDRHVFDFSPDEVEALVVKAGSRRLELERREAGFVMRAPEEGEVDGEVGNQRLQELFDLRGELVEAPVLAELGLAPASGSVTLRLLGREAKIVTSEVKVSAPRPDGSVYVQRLADGGVLQVGREGARLLIPDATLVRAREVMSFDRRELHRVRIEGPSGVQELLREDDGTISLLKPPGLGHDAGLVTELVEHLASLRAERWVSDEDDGSFGLAAGSTRVSVELTSNDPKAAPRKLGLIVGSPAPGGFYGRLTNEQGVFVVPRAAGQIIQSWLVDRSLLMIEPKEVERIELRRGEQRWVLRRDGERFTVEQGELDASRAALIVEQLAVLAVEGTVRVGAARPEEGFGKPVLSVDIERLPARGERSTPIRLRFGAGDTFRDAAIYYARREGTQATFAVSRGRLQPILDAL
ncbi:MAG: DUF4340 domain-containing protein [Polyangiaceae bacterium]|nr:DUF4340 domain-containing protein [Polyangiaceae bacterium]MCW5789310.1 DUF4340 domain-containing protein [Polyangiaceae bacterium]